MTPAPATVAQLRQFMALLGKEPTTKQVQRLLANGDVVKAIVEGRLSREQLLGLLNKAATRFNRYNDLLLSLGEQKMRLHRYSTKYWDGRFLDERGNDRTARFWPMAPGPLTAGRVGRPTRVS